MRNEREKERLGKTGRETINVRERSKTKGRSGRKRKYKNGTKTGREKV